MDRQTLVLALTDNVPQLAEQIAQKLAESQLETYQAMADSQLLQVSQAALQSFLRDLAEDQERHFAGYWQAVAEARVAQGARLEDLLQGVFRSEAVLDARAQVVSADSPELYTWWLRRLHRIIYSGITVLAEVFVVLRERLILAQQAQIRELSTPIVPLYPGVLALPIVGAVDSHRAGQIMEALLTGITDHKATVVIIDITGVPMVDTTVANYLIQSARAAGLLGAKVVLVGIGPEIAQTIVQLGVELTGITTRANLQSGIEYALSLLGLAIVPVTRPSKQAGPAQQGSQHP